MSNLTLPNMSFESLNRKFDKRRTIAYETQVEKFSALDNGEFEPAFHVFHHGNLIANIGNGKLWLSNGGWNSTTTANRLDKIAVANMGLTFRMCLRDQLIQVVPQAHCGRTKADRATWVYLGSRGMSFECSNDEWKVSE